MMSTRRTPKKTAGSKPSAAGAIRTATSKVSAKTSINFQRSVRRK
jgi:hypothetical protein